MKIEQAPRSHSIGIPVLVLIVLFLLSAPRLTPVLDGQSDATYLTVSVPAQQYVKIVTPSSSNITIVSASGGLYQLSVSNGLNTNILEFVPTNSSNYTLVVQVTSNDSNYAYVSKQGTAFDLPVKNVTGAADILLSLRIVATESTGNGNNWDPLFGLTGIKLQAAALSFAVVIEIITALGILLIAAGVITRSRISYLGLLLLIISGTMVLGFLMLLGVVAAYLASFGVVNLVWKLHSRSRTK